MKIAQVTSTFPPYEGGIGNACLNLSTALQGRGHDVTVFVPELRAGSARFAGPLKVRYLRPTLTIGNASWLPRLIPALQGYDIIHLQYPFFGGDLFVRAAARRWSIPYVLTYHQDVRGDSWWKQAIFRSYNWRWQRQVMASASKIFVLSQNHYQQSDIRHLKSRADHIAVVPNGVDFEKFRQPVSTDNIRQNRKIPAHTPLIIFIGALDAAHYFKGLDLLLRAAAQLKLPWHLLIIGDGDRRPMFEQLAQALQVHDRVTFVGHVPNEQIPGYLQQSDFLVLPSTDTESFGIVLIEAMAAGCPVIASDLAGIQAVVQPGQNGLLFRRGDMGDLTEKLSQFIQRPDWRRPMGLTGGDMVRAKYSWTKIAQDVEGLYRGVVVSQRQST